MCATALHIKYPSASGPGSAARGGSGDPISAGSRWWRRETGDSNHISDAAWRRGSVCRRLGEGSIGAAGGAVEQQETPRGKMHVIATPLPAQFAGSGVCWGLREGDKRRGKITRMEDTRLEDTDAAGQQRRTAATASINPRRRSNTWRAKLRAQEPECECSLSSSGVDGTGVGVQGQGHRSGTTDAGQPHHPRGAPVDSKAATSTSQPSLVLGPPGAGGAVQGIHTFQLRSHILDEQGAIQSFQTWGGDAFHHI
ncbi:uncharacterized protein LOC135116241 isoform X2 [Scylla paramamosain]|uniref:uncharacterized protein LOC135116241 isoform X2 n=1 Tax=Scylla paramamosain TaxID=85552 RepID=UPI003083351A